ncbi:MAG: efflux RND transporter periplasmic adaptor subunit [Gammaproteobacteria bacterium]|nr:efflux RND transporter periplasmic adaptor subunit [Gammaproteobacteria bacterium]MBU2224354.1 efflux RND transporter periplasmic adaptor subunit [Gammaproteobacteria bacterium]
MSFPISSPIKLTLLLSVFLLSSCDDSKSSVPTYELHLQPLQHQVNADGELFAVNSVSINAPASRGPRFIAQISPEFSEIAAGQTVVIFDSTQLQREKREANTALAGVVADKSKKQTEQQGDLLKLGLDQQLVKREFTFADRFNIDDVQIRSRLEILDSMQNKEFLSEKQQYLGWQQQSFQQKSQGELELLQLQQDQQQSLLSQAESGLNALEIKAPHRGVLLFETNWRGEKPEVGGMVFPGSKIGSIPDLSLQHIKLQVIEQEAKGLAEGQQVRFVMAADPGQQLTGKVLNVSQVARSRERRDPRKYIDIVVEPAKQHPAFMPGIKIRATIDVMNRDQVLLVPLHAIFNAEQQLFVWKLQGSRFEKQPISIGEKSLTHAEVLTGLEVDDRIALIDIGS